MDRIIHRSWTFASGLLVVSLVGCLFKMECCRGGELFKKLKDGVFSELPPDELALMSSLFTEVEGPTHIRNDVWDLVGPIRSDGNAIVYRPISMSIIIRYPSSTFPNHVQEGVLEAHVANSDFCVFGWDAAGRPSDRRQRRRSPCAMSSYRIRDSTLDRMVVDILSLFIVEEERPNEQWNRTGLGTIQYEYDGTHWKRISLKHMWETASGEE